MSLTIPGTWETSLTPEILARQRTVSAPRVSPDGHSIAYAMEFDGRTDLFVLRDAGWPLQITADRPLAGGSYDRSPSGDQFVFTSSDGKLWLCPSSGGNARQLSRGEGRHHSPSFSPDGRFVCFLSDRGDEIDVVVISVDGRLQRVISRGSDFPLHPLWAPDSERIVWSAYPNGLMPWDQGALVIGDASGGEPQTIAGASRVTYASPSFSPDGARIVCVCDRLGALNVTEIGADGTGERVLHEDRWEHGEPSYSPDGRRIVYTRNVDGDYTLWLTESGGGAHRPLTNDSGRAAAPS